MSYLLSDRASGRDNNFNLIRFIAASLVLFSHCYPLTATKAEPLEECVGFTLGTFAVDLFFIVSGFLVAGSLITRKNIAAFIRSRTLRIFPGLAAAVCFCALVVGGVFTSLPMVSYFSSLKVYAYLFKNVSLLSIQHKLPGVFESNPYPYAVNGSLWTLPYEIRMYLALTLLGVFVYAGSRRVDEKWLKRAIVLACALSAGVYLWDYFQSSGSPDAGLRLWFMFFGGALFFVARSRIVISHSVFILVVSALICARMNEHAKLFFLLYNFTIAYLVLYLAYTPSGFVRGFNRLGDYSYGIYIYAFPVQQSVAATMAGVGVMQMFAIAFPVTLLLAVISWHLIEKPMLKKKDMIRSDESEWLRGKNRPEARA